MQQAADIKSLYGDKGKVLLPVSVARDLKLMKLEHVTVETDPDFRLGRMLEFSADEVLKELEGRKKA